jgi:hypothetical protein
MNSRGSSIAFLRLANGFLPNQSNAIQKHALSFFLSKSRHWLQYWRLVERTMLLPISFITNPSNFWLVDYHV